MRSERISTWGVGGPPYKPEKIHPIRYDPKFAEITKTRIWDPELYEFKRAES